MVNYKKISDDTYIMDKQTIKNWVKNHIELSFGRSSGPGGQNVNKLSTKATAKLSLSNMCALIDDEKDRVRLYLKNRINNEDKIVVQVQEQRKQLQNREIAIERMTNLILKSLKKKKKRLKTRPTQASKEKRIMFKKIIGEKKKQREKVDYDE